MIKSLSDLSQTRVVAMIVGPSGIGKTFLASTLEGRTLIASAESGLLCLAKLPLEAREMIDVFEIKNIEDYKQFFIACMKPENKKKYQNLFIDSLTEIGERILSEMKDDPKYSEDKMMLKLYGKFNDDFAKYVKALRDMAPYNVFFTCLNKYEKDGMSLKEEFSFPGAKTKDSIKAWLDLVLKYEVFEKDDQKFRMLVTDVTVNPLAKDRSGVLNQYEPAHLGNIMKKIKGE